MRRNLKQYLLNEAHCSGGKFFQVADLETAFFYVRDEQDAYVVECHAFLGIDLVEDFFSAVNSLQTCQFTAFSYLLEPPIAKYTPKPLLKFAMTYLPSVAQMVLDLSPLASLLTSITGRKVSAKEILKSGGRTHVLERHMNCLMGISRSDDTLPRRFLEESETKHPVKSVVPLEPLLDAYYRKKGYDAEGIPMPSTLKRLGIGFPEGEKNRAYRG